MCNFNTLKNSFKNILVTLISPFESFRPLFKKSSSLVFDNRGQAVVEYLLITLVTITLVLGLATKFMPQLNEYLQNYAGSYVECLLETGELPPPFDPPNSECTIENMKASGRITTPSNNVASSGGNGSSNQVNRSDNSSSNQNNTGSSGGGGSRSGSPGSAPRPFSPTNAGTDGSNTANMATSGRGAGNNSSISNPSSGTTETGSIKNPYAAQQDNGQGISGRISAPRTAASEIDRNLSGKSNLKKDNTLGGENLRQGSFSAPVNKKDGRDPNDIESADMGFNFGLYLRYFLIAGILLALFIMIATQLNTMRKSWGTQ